MTIAGVTSIQPGVSELVSLGMIRTGQGFFVKTKTGLTTANLVFNNNMRSGDVSNLFYKTSNTANVEKHRIWLNLSHANETISQNLIGYVTGATNGFDYSFEGKNFGSNPISLSSLVDDNEYNIQARSLPFDPADIVPLNFKTDISGSYSISIDHVDGLFETNQDIFLLDNLTGTMHNLKQTAYSFNSEVGNFNTRFALKYQNQLDVINPILDGNNVVIYKQNGTIQINSGNIIMDKIEIYDISGRLLYSKANVNATTENLTKLSIKNQLLIVKIKSVENVLITKKIIY